MGWNIEEDGFGVRFSRDIPQFVRSKMRQAADRFLEQSSVPFESLDQFIFHPGGAKVLSALEDAFEISPSGLKLARDVLREYGNMSAATVLFVLERALAQHPSGVGLVGALGPGFSAGFLVMDDI